MDKILKLMTYVEGGILDSPFPNEANQIAIGAFRYDAKRMGGAPTITASVNYPYCLDGVWTDGVYAEFNGEKYYLKQTPTSSYSNEDSMYKHDIELISERVILDNVYFYDAIAEGEPNTDDKPVSNSTKFVFWGSIYDFANRLKASLKYSGIDYDVVVDEGVSEEEKLVAFENTFFSNAIQESYNTFDIPYYFTYNKQTQKKEIHFGYSNTVVGTPFEYGVDNALLSITKANANYKTANRVTGTGSSDNIPYYYPNNSPKGDIEAATNREELGATIVNAEDFANKIEVDGEIVYEAFSITDVYVTSEQGRYNSGDELFLSKLVGNATRQFDISFTANNAGVFKLNLDCIISNVRKPLEDASVVGNVITHRFSVDLIKVRGEKERIVSSTDSGNIEIPISMSGAYVVRITLELASKYTSSILTCNYALLYSYDEGFTGWLYKGREVSLDEIGLAVSGYPISGDTITQRIIKYVKPSDKLMPSIYRETDGAERFYNAMNNTYEGVEFANPYTEGHPKEHIITVEDLKPTIKETMVNGLRIDMFSEFAYDNDDNDETYEDEDGNVFFQHPYFFGKLRKMDFNLFDHAIENQPMVISFTSGNAGACSFEIGVTEEYPQKNPVQVDSRGNLIYDDNGMVLCGCEGTDQFIDNYQESQQDTINNEVWIALRKEEETYGILMPSVAHRPKACTSATSNDGDTFVILGINLPKTYTTNAEKKLEEEIIKYMQENNEEKFKFSINFSRIYFEENSTILENLDENSRITVRYNGENYELYVNSFSYQMSEGDVLPQITVELDEALTISQNALQNAINGVKSEVGRALSNIDVLGLSTPFFLRKDTDDEAQGKINFKKGIKFGEGGKVEVLDNNSAKLTIEYLEVTKKASFTSLEIQEKTHVGGQMLVTPAAINCGEVEEFDNYYRCYFQTKGVDGDEIFNQFVIGDQAICQTYNAWGSRYYWRLVVGIGEDYIDLSKTDCDEDSDVPSAGDKIIQLGNRAEEERQNAIVIAAYGEGSPYIIQYKRINSFNLTNEMIVTKLSSTENIFTGKVHMELGSDGLENIEGGLNIGGQNMLRNSGFTGNYLSEPLADRIVMEESSEMFSDPLDFWFSEDYPKDNATVVDSEESSSGKELVLANGSVTQELYQRVIGGEKYVLSFKAKGANLTYTIGGVSKTMPLTDTWVRYIEKFDALQSGSIFSIINATCVLCDIQLERGTMATSWGMSPLDNSSDRAYWQSMKYVQEAVEGATDVYGGLVLTHHIKVGNRLTDDTFVENGGINGDYISNESPAFWAGGDFDKAISTVNKFTNNPTYQPNESELASMASFVVSHGGRAILNDVIMHGYVYAKGGVFNGDIYADDGVFGGFIKKKATHITNENIDSYLPQGSNGYRTINIKTVGSIMYIETTLTTLITFELPIAFKGQVYDTSQSNISIEDLRGMIGSEVLVYNVSAPLCHFCGYAPPNDNDGEIIYAPSLVCFGEGEISGAGNFCRATCKLSLDRDGYEMIYWKLEKGFFVI